MNADHFFTIGRPHLAQGTPCEDYALSGKLREELAFAVVTDGCSGAHANTDVGARVLAHAFTDALAARANLPEEWFAAGFVEDLLARFERTQYTGNGLDHLATLVGLAATPQRACTFVFGDGAVAVRFCDGRHRLYEFEWWDNTPLYLQYRLLPATLDQFLAPYADGVIEPFAIRQTDFAIRDDGTLEVLAQTTTRKSVDEAFDGQVLEFRPQDEGIEVIAVLTDGVARVGLPEQSRPAIELAREFLAFKNTNGSFVKRRLLRALAALAKQGAVPQDDLSMAAIWFGKDAQ